MDPLLLTGIVTKIPKQERESSGSLCVSVCSEQQRLDLAGFTDTPAVMGLPAKSVTVGFESVEINEQKQCVAFVLLFSH